LESGEIEIRKDQTGSNEHTLMIILCTQISWYRLWRYDDVSASVQVPDFVQLTDSKGSIK